MSVHDEQVTVEQYSGAMKKKGYGGIEHAIECALTCFFHGQQFTGLSKVILR